MRLSGPSVADTTVLTAKSPVPVLIVDDNPSKRLALKAILAPLGYLIVEADSGTEALRCVMAQDFAVILLDVCMPVMDGFETAALIRQRRQSEMTPIIFITAFKSDEVVHANRYAEGAVDFIFAPVPPDDLRAKVSVFANLFIKAEELAARAREVQASADQLRLLTDAAPIGIFQTDAENHYVYTNPRWAEITGIRPEDAFGRAWETIIGAEERAGLIAELSDGPVYRDELCHRFELQVPGSASRILLVTSKSIPDSAGGIAGWVGTLADVTAEAGAEAAMADARDEANEASRLKSDFLANMSHEIRTPMNGVIGMTDLLLETELDDRQRDYAQTVRNSGEALLTIINDILDFSKVEAGKLEIEDIEFDLRAIVYDVVDLLARPAQAKGLDLVALLEPSVPAVVSGDPGRVRQVLTNLVGNAIKFTQSGEIVLRVIGDEIVGAQTVIRFEVRDTGDGIAPDKLELVFEPFVQADSSTSRRYGGTGLGLAISGQLVALMSGQCGASSELGVGSCFWFTIRVRAEAGQPRNRLLTPDPDLAGVAVLIVDDSVAQLGVLSEYLAAWGMAISTAVSGPAALAAMQAGASRGEPFAVALIDRSMPGMNGLDLKDAIAADPSLTVGVVLMTGLGEERELGTAQAAGIAALLAKPVHRTDLRACLRRALGLPAAEVPSAGAAAHRRSPAGSLQVGRLLLAEDNLINQKVAVAILAGAGYRVDTVRNGAEALEAVTAHPYDAILMDCQMPVLSGYEATAAIRASEEESGRHTPIIAMTAGARREDRERCLAEGMDAYLSKPVNKDALLAVVARFLSRSGVAPAPRVADGGVPELTIDPAMLDELRVLGVAAERDFLAELVDQFILETEPLLVELGEALEEADGEAVGRIAHSIMGSSAQLGGRRLALSCGLLEGKATAGSLSGGRADLDDVTIDYQDLRRSLIQELSPDDRQHPQDCEPPGGPAGPVLDPAIRAGLERLGQASDEDLIGQLTSLFLSDAPGWVTALRRGLESGDAGEVAWSAHTMSGASANVGASELARLCATLSNDGTAGDLSRGEALLGAVEGEFARVCSALSSWEATP
jgi:PAS domain S-box-containing protein